MLTQLQREYYSSLFVNMGLPQEDIKQIIELYEKPEFMPFHKDENILMIQKWEQSEK